MSDRAARLLSPEEIAVRAGGEIPFLRFPERATLFGEREMRLRQLAAGHAMRDFLLFVAEVAKAQGALLNRPIEVALPSDAQIEAAANAGVAPLAADRWPRDPRWRDLLRDLLADLEKGLPEGPARAVVAGLRAADDAHLEQQADRLLHGVAFGLDVGSAPLVAAGLQVYFSHLVAATRRARSGDRLAPFGRIDHATRCPCCASEPVASVTRIGAAEAGHRYLHCALCAAQWHYVRIKCARCQSTKGIGYQSLATDGEASTGRPPGRRADTDAPGGRAVAGGEAAGRAVEIESCAECGHYLKIVHMERDPSVDPVADDLATLTLDLLAAEAGIERHGHNPMLVFGDPEAEAAAEPRPGGG